LTIDADKLDAAALADPAEQAAGDGPCGQVRIQDRQPAYPLSGRGLQASGDP
jgi:hypothetical protein